MVIKTNILQLLENNNKSPSVKQTCTGYGNFAKTFM